jgi:S-adenosylmethionine:diacylglycerol 3-amino-3-carboxypropyl transferase
MSHVTTRKLSVINASVVLVERDVVRKAERTMDEQQLIAMLRDLPLPITLTPHEGKYIWECYAERGRASCIGYLAHPFEKEGLWAFIASLFHSVRWS